MADAPNKTDKPTDKTDPPAGGKKQLVWVALGIVAILIMWLVSSLLF